MKLNNKGFATTAIMYSILTLILMLLLGSMAYLANRKKVLDKIKQDTYNEVNEILSLDTVEFDYTGEYKEFKVLKTGYYKIEAWGAQGGSATYNSNSAQGGEGAYTSGYIYLNKGTILKIKVGGQGQSTNNTTASSSTGYNGGGFASFYTNNSSHGGGGGATTISVDNTINSNIMVAAGGGGAAVHTGYPNYSGKGGVGGALVGGSGNPTSSTCYSFGNGGTQTTAGTSSLCSQGGAAWGSNSNDTTTNISAGFGVGANYSQFNSGSGYAYSGGGAGYYGGQSGYHAPGGGGSSFISGYAGVNAVTSASSTTLTNNTKHYSGKYFLGGVMKAGNELMPTHDGNSTMIGNSGNGYAKISYIGGTITRKDVRLNNVRYIKSCMNGNTANAGNHWVEIQAIKDGVNIAKGKTVTGTHTQNNTTTNAYSNIVDGLFDNITGSTGFGSPNTSGVNACITVDLGSAYNLDEIAAWNWWVNGRAYYNNIVSVSSNNSSWTTIYNNFESETTQGKRINAYVINDNANYLFNYTGSSQSFTAPISGYYKFEAWGASGGNNGGLGGYTSGNVFLNENDSIKVYVGGQGGQSSSYSTTTRFNGGYNGGGTARGPQGGQASRIWGSGGGATDFRYTGTSVNDRIMVAGAGGGNYSNPTVYKGGFGGNLFAGSGVNSLSNLSYGGPGTGANQTSGGYHLNTSGTAVEYGQFGSAVTGPEGDNYYSGGGGGYYGGGNSGHVQSGGGGSSFISGFAGVNAITSASSTSPSNNTRHYSGKYFIGGNMISGLNTGNGKSVITYLGNLNEEKVFNNNYQKLEYIQSTGTQYIDTGFKATPNTVVDIDFQFTEVSTLQQRLFGSGTSSDSYLNYQMYINGAGAWAYSFKDGSGNWVSTNVTADTNKHNIRFNIPLGQFLIDNNSYSIASSTRTKSTQNNFLIMYATPSDSGEKIGKMKLYAFKMYDKNELVRDMIPVKRKSDNAIGMYDKVTKKFYANAGTGTFTAGPVIDLTNVRYIKDCTSGSSANSSNHWVELQAIKDGVNIAKGKTATGITNNSGKPISNITDGDLTTANYAEGGSAAPTCVTLDLGSTYDLDEIAVWHYWGDSRVYNNHTLSVSNNNSTWRNLITSKEKETSQGKRVSSHY